MTHPPRRRRALVITAVALSAAIALTGCTSSKKPVTGSVKSSGSNKTIDEVKSVLIKPSDITIDKFTLTTLSPVSQSGAVGISAIFANGNHMRVLSEILIHYPTAADASAAAPEEQTVAAGELTHNPASDTPLAVGQLGQLYQGSNDTGPLSIAVFAEGAWVVTMEFISKTAGDNVPASVVTDLATKQDTLIKTAR